MKLLGAFVVLFVVCLATAAYAIETGQQVTGTVDGKAVSGKVVRVVSDNSGLHYIVFNPATNAVVTVPASDFGKGAWKLSPFEIEPAGPPRELAEPGAPAAPAAPAPGERKPTQAEASRDPTYQVYKKYSKDGSGIPLPGGGWKSADGSVEVLPYTPGDPRIVQVRQGDKRTVYDTTGGQPRIVGETTGVGDKETGYAYKGDKYVAIKNGKQSELNLVKGADGNSYPQAPGTDKYYIGAGGALYDTEGKPVSNKDQAAYEKTLSQEDKATLDAARGSVQKEKAGPSNTGGQTTSKGVLNVFNKFFSGYEQFSGLGSFTSLFMDEEDLAKRREEVNKAFCDTIILGGTQCWASKLCQKYSDIPSRGSLAYAETPGGLLTVVGHIEAERAQPAYAYNDTRLIRDILYKVTFSVSNPDSESENAYNIRFEGDKTYYWFGEDQILKPGGSDSRTGNAALVAYSRNVYSRVCIEFARSVQTFTGSRRTVCNRIVQASGVPTLLPGAGTPTQPAPGGRQPGQGF